MYPAPSCIETKERPQNTKKEMRQTTQRLLEVVTLITTLFSLMGCEPKPATSPATRAPVNAAPDVATKKSQGGEGFTVGKKFWVKYSPKSDPIPFQELFEMELEIYDPTDQKTPVAGVKLDQVRAVMPAHKHGMKVKPIITEISPGKFLVEGMRFHMRGQGDDGRWVLEAVINHEGELDQTSFDIQCCEI